MKAASSSGLEGVVAAQTALSHVDGEKGELIIAGSRIESLAGHRRFEQVCALLWSEASVDLGPSRVAAFARLPALGGALELVDGMDALRAALAQLPSDSSALQVTAATGVFAAAWWRRRAGLPPVAPDPRLEHAADVLRMVRGEPASGPLVDGLDAYLVTVIDTE